MAQMEENKIEEVVEQAVEQVVQQVKHTVTISIATEQREFDGSVVSGGIRVSLGDARVQFLSHAPYEVVFANVDAGDYVITAVAVDASGAVISEPITGSVSIAADVPQPEITEVVVPKVVLDVPASLTVTVS
jgi:hypothetical protein